MNEKNLIYKGVKEFAEKVDLSPTIIDNVEMGYVFEELIYIGSEQANDQTTQAQALINC